MRKLYSESYKCHRTVLHDNFQKLDLVAIAQCTDMNTTNFNDFLTDVERVWYHAPMNSAGYNAGCF